MPRRDKPAEVRYLARLAPFETKGAAFLELVRHLSSSLGVHARNPKWTSHGALELDLFAPSESDVRLLLASLEPLCRIEFSKDLRAPPLFEPKHVAVRRASELFDDERYWESHEVLEEVWRNLEGDEKLFVQGVILVCAAFVHHQKGDDEGARRVLARARNQLGNYRGGDYFGIDVPTLKANVDACLDSSRFEKFMI